MSEDSLGSLLYAEAGQIWEILGDGTSEDYLGKIDGHQINTMLRDNEGGLWIGTMGRASVRSALWPDRSIPFVSTLFLDIVESIFQDREGNVWATFPDNSIKNSR